MEDNLNSFENERRRQFIKNRRQRQKSSVIGLKILKVEYLSYRFLDHTQILNLSIDS